MCAEVRDFPIISGGDKITTVGDLIDLTPKDLISKVMLEEKVFETWHHKRIALMGDGKLLRSGSLFFPINRRQNGRALFLTPIFDLVVCILHY